jgi:DNA-binding PadR family transcriptional regulator
MSRPKLEMTTTSYAVLGLLCLRPWSAYELTQQMERSLRFMWPRAESGIYREPQKLISLGYATVNKAAAGPRRTKAVYSATPQGRRALRKWLTTPSAPPQFESEAMVKFFFSDQGSVNDANRALDDIISHAGVLMQAFRTNTATYADGTGPFPERLHIGAVRGRFIHDLARTLIDWATWAKEHVDEWPDTGPAAAPLGQIVQNENIRLAEIGHEARPAEREVV